MTYLTAADVAAMYRVRRELVYAETKKGNLPHFRIGRKILYSREALARWVEEQEKGSH